MAPSRMAEQVGRVLGGRYRLVAPIGAGASAQVFLADDVALRRRVAVKLLHPALADDEGFLRRFRAEAQAAAALSHPNVMAVYDWGDQDTPYLVLEYLGGGSLRAMLDRGARLSPAQALGVGLEAARALDYAHRRGFVHRDVKPANLLFDDEGRLRIADFGLARALAEAAWTEPQGAVVGTARYASPEQARGEPVTGKADVYALALVLVEAVTGKVPFAADTTIGTLMARIDKPLEVPDELGPLKPVLERAGSPDPQERPDAEELGKSLLAAARQLDAPAPLPLAGAIDEPDVTVIEHGDPTLLPEPARAVDGDGDGRGEHAAVVGTPSMAPGRRRRRWPWIALAILLVGALGAGGAFAWQQLTVATAAVPRLEGLTEDQAVQLLQRVQEGEDLEWEVERQEDYVDGTNAGIVFRQDPDEGEDLRDGGTISYTVSLGPPPREVPDIEGLTEAEARAALEEADIEVEGANPMFHESVERGRVVSWWQGDVEKPREVAKGSSIVLIVSQGPEPRSVPDLAGRTFEEAAAELEKLGLKAEKAEEFSRTVDQGRVIRTEPTAGESVERGGTVKVVVSKGRDLVSVPKMSGMSIAEATAALEKAGLERGDVFGRGDTVFAAQPEFGTKVDRGTVVDLYVRP